MKAHEVFARERDELMNQLEGLKADNERLKQESAAIRAKLQEKDAHMAAEKENLSAMLKEQMKSMEEDLNEAYQKQHELQKQFEEERKRIQVIFANLTLNVNI